MGKDQELIDACRSGNKAAAEKLLASKLASKGRGPKAAGANSGGGGALSMLRSGISSLKGVNVNCSDNSGDTPLHLAALNGHLDIVSLLLDCDANPTLLDTQDCSPLHLAAWNGHTEICSELLLSPEGQALLNLQTRDGNTALHFAAHHGHTNVLALLLQKGGDPVIRNLEDKSPLDLAAQYDRLDIVMQLVMSHPELVAQRSIQNTPLHLASRLGHKAVVRYLLDSGFPIDAKTDKGTALHEAANFCKLDVIRLLLERGIDISVKSHTGCTAEDILRSIPSRAAEEALNILKTHIYHQRTPDSDGEKSIVDEPVPETHRPEAPPSHANVPISVVETPSFVEQKSNLYKSLPHGNEGSTGPPPIMPRHSHSVRLPDKTDESADHSPSSLTVPYNSEASALTLRDSFGESDKSRNSIALQDISPSPKSPTDLPKKPPRKKTQSFRRNEQGSPFTPTSNGIHHNAPGGKNYVNLDPQIERALVEGKLDFKPQAPQTTVILPSNEDNDGSQSQQRDPAGQDSQELNPLQSNESGVEAQRNSIGSGTGVATAEEDKDMTEMSSSPPSSLDIVPASRTSAARSSVTPPSPTKRHEPPTPDCPPPSPSTALLNIQRQILPTEKRRSKDMETITDTSITERQEPEEEQAPVVQAVTLPRPAQKKKPTPLPRKSSLSSDTRDIPASLSTKEGYSGGRPMSVPARMARQSDGLQKENSLSQIISSESPQVSAPGARMSSTDSTTAATAAAAPHQTASSEDSASKGEICIDYDNEPVQMRRSSSADNKPGGWDDNVFA
ncbi:ankyrin repeat and sterile alpha motif domain-containing protein 1b, partial [Plakobranchus ocellatus]